LLQNPLPGLVHVENYCFLYLFFGRQTSRSAGIFPSKEKQVNIYQLNNHKKTILTG